VVPAPAPVTAAPAPRPSVSGGTTYVPFAIGRAPTRRA
jgi:hypothetical protein